ncbi:MAG: 50S ribosomal protein L18 [Candidatus Syntrophonatronum acetioxidans]|uniref:Large ribosomal subunit protein uL18 n=1 Tax=Candidatus Syntrophonatronum acetioxidans TaxID=1795816 RepID=A0A424YH49_9FIRM|nr:MAG: 50S ribosomal protein L18 [Candidatus Syntrophonatronum acetioxidans]
MFRKKSRNALRKKRHMRIRNKLSGTPERPRLNVFRSLKHIYAQIIDDLNGRTLVSVSSLDPEIQENGKTGNIDTARQVGEVLARKALENEIREVVFDRGGYRYHGRVKALAEGAREKGLKF